MKDANPTSSLLGRWIIGVSYALLLILMVAWVIENHCLQINILLAAVVLGVLGVLSVAAWWHGFRWFFGRRGLRFFAWFIVGIVSVIVLFYAEESWRGKRAWAALEREVAARGESLELSSVSPPPVPDAENFALAPGVPQLLGYAEREPGQTPTNTFDNPEIPSFYYGSGRSGCPALGNWALQQTTDLAAWQKFFRRHPRTDADATNRGGADILKAPGGYTAASQAVPYPRLQFPVAPEPQAPAADVLLALSPNDPALALLRAANQRPKVRYPIAYEDGLFALHRRHEHFEDNLRAAVSLLCLRAVAELAQAQSDTALEDTLVALRLADSFRQEPYDQLHRHRIGMLRLCLQPVWEGLARHRWNEAQLLTLQQRFAAMDLLGEFRLRVRGETLVTMNLADQLHAMLQGRRSAWGEHIHSQEEERWLVWILRVAYPIGWLYQDKVQAYRFYERRADVFKALAGDNRQQMDAELRRTTDPFFLIFVVPRLREILHEGAQGALFFQTTCQQASVACALERYRLAQGAYPDSLDALVPAWIKQVPADLLDPAGAKLRYRREDDGGFVLYSIGLNRQDDHGKSGSPDGATPPFPRLDDGDWVWSQPGQS
jgi:hypothetical protein